MSITTNHHFPNDLATANKRAALVSTTTTGSPLVNAPFHTVQISLTPAGAASLYRLLNRAYGERACDHIIQLQLGLRDAAIDALERS